MLILGNDVGELKSLDLYNQHKKVGVTLEDLASIDTSSINNLKCNKENKIFYGSSNGIIGLINKKTKKMIKNKNFNFEEMTTFHNFENGSVIAFYSDYIRLWKNFNGICFLPEKKLICKKKFKYVFVDKKEQFFLSASFYGNEIFLWNILDNKIFFVGKNELKELIVSFNGNRGEKFTIGTHTGSVYIYSIYGEMIRSLKKNLDQKSEKSDVQTSAAWQEETVLFSGKSRGKIEIFDLRCNKNISNIKGHSCEILNLDISTKTTGFSSFFLASSDRKGMLKLWDTRKLNEVFFQKKYNTKITSLIFV